MKRIAVFAVLAATLATIPASAQAVPKHPKQSPPLSAEGVQQLEEAIAEDPKLSAQRERFNAEMARNMYEMREQLERDAFNRMSQARYQRSNQERIPGELIAFAVFVIILGAILWLIRTIVENRRWNRIASIQTEVHTKLLEKLSSNQELLSYMETEAGKRFLESSPFEIEHRTSPTFPYGRILLSAQAGMVALVVGAGLLWLQKSLPDDVESLVLFGTLVFALGIGLVLSAFLSYSMSKHFGLTPNSDRRSEPMRSEQ